ncbi:MBL fold metallo-hydrolase [Aureimonas endophytica]|uniref:MBL fold metallo-hydrolase n=1 Tax=Aureimonas endophytica TaxID=2027858 RepID=A0A916ZWI1_9HYPH|nr:MBL fold metallo-hydrolase [Aureimonas endophytica]GGE14974.1 MBL fold metallo-hydrolase [Aureimonas endophytica]
MRHGKGETAGGIDRRRALQLAGGLALAPLAGPALAAGAQTNGTETGMQDERAEPRWRRYRIGDATITVVEDGQRIADGPYPTFGADQEEATVAALLRENFLPEKRFANGFLPVLVETGGRRVLFDTGMGPMGRANGMGLLRQRLEEAGHRPDDIDLVVLTHMHGDHIGGLMEEGGPAFSKARLAMGRVEYDFWTSEEAKNGERRDNAALVAKNVAPLAADALILAEGTEVVPGIVAHEAFGHSPGHLVFEIGSGDDALWLTADTANHYVASLQRPDWRVRFDQDPERATATRRRVFDGLAASRRPFIGYHMPFPGIGFVEKAGEGYRFVPLTYQLDVAG